MTPRTKAGANFVQQYHEAMHEDGCECAAVFIRAPICTIEDEMLDKVAAAVEHMAEYWVRPERVLAAIERIRRDDNGR